MEREDQLIKELIQEGLLKPAPDDFTDNVMLAVSKTSQTEKSISDFSVIIYALVIAASIGLSVGVIYIFKPSFFQNVFAFFGSFIQHIYYSFSSIFDGPIKYGSGIELNNMVVGVAFIIATLLIFDSFLGKRRSYMNLFA